MLWSTILLWSACATPHGDEVPVTGKELLGSWVHDDGEYRQILSFLADGRFEVYTTNLSGPFEEPASYDGGGKWRVSGDRLVLSAMTHEPGAFGPESGQATISIMGDVMTMTEAESKEVDVMHRTDWLPPAIPADAVRKSFYETVNGAGRIVLTPEKSEGRPGDRIAMQVSLTNTDTQSYYVPVQLDDRINLRMEESLPEGSVRLNIEEPPSGIQQLRSRLLAPGETVSFAAAFKVPAQPGLVTLKAFVHGSDRATATNVPFRVLPADDP